MPSPQDGARPERPDRCRRRGRPRSSPCRTNPPNGAKEPPQQPFRRRGARRGRREPASVVQLTQLIEVEGPELRPDSGSQHAQHADRQQDVQRSSQFDEERHPGGGQKGDEGDAVVDEQEADDLRHRLAPHHHREEPDQQCGESERNQPTCRCRDQPDDGFGRAVGEERERSRNDQRCRHVHDRRGFTAGGVPGHDPAQQRRDEEALRGQYETGDGDQDHVVLMDAEDESRCPERDSLQGQSFDDGRERTTPHRDHGTHQDQSRRELEQAGVGGPVHRTTSAVTVPSTASTNPPASSSGTRKSRNLAVKTSKMAIHTPASATLTASIAIPMTRAIAPGRSAIPQGARRLTRRPRSSENRMASPVATRARSGPAYSSTIASWIMVSSRWVLGLSTGSRPLSARMMIANEPSARIRPGLAVIWGWVNPSRTRTGRLEVWAGIDMAKMATSRAGSAIAPMVIARLDPIPPNGVPVSRAARARAAEPSRSTKTMAKKSALLPRGGRVVAR